jgi:ribonuclease P protein component
LGITVSKKYGKAHLRNHFKRVVRESFRHLSSLLPQGMDVNVHPRLGCQEISKKNLIDDFKLILHAEPRTKKSC